MQKIILLIEDDPDDVELFCEALKEINKNCYCNHVYDAESALQLLKTNIVKPEYIFLDVNLPGTASSDFLLQLKKIEEFENIPVIIYSTLNHKPRIEELYALGAAYFLIKPASFEALKHAIKKVLKSRFEKKRPYQ